MDHLRDNVPASFLVGPRHWHGEDLGGEIGALSDRQRLIGNNTANPLKHARRLTNVAHLKARKYTRLGILG